MKKKNTLVKDATDTLKVGTVSMLGYGLLGGLSTAPGMPPQAGNVTRLAGAGLTLANVGQLGKVSMNLAKTVTPKKTKKKSIWL